MIDKTEILLKVALNTITINIFSRDKANHVGMGNNNYGRSEPASKTATVTLLPLPDYRLCLYVWRLNVLLKVMLRSRKYQFSKPLVLPDWSSHPQSTTSEANTLTITCGTHSVDINTRLTTIIIMAGKSGLLLQ
jgi:hypothetical protein